MAGKRLTTAEAEERKQACLKHRYTNKGTQVEWVAFCHENYGDKSEQQYIQYWIAAKEMYEEGWREKLSGLLDPAVNELISLLADDDARIRQRAVDQIMKYTGNDVLQIDANIGGEIKLNVFFDEGDDNDEVSE